MAADENDQILSQAAQLYPQAPGEAMSRLQGLSEKGDDRATALLAYFNLQQGDIDTALPLADRAVSAGYGQLAQAVAMDLSVRGRPELRDRTPHFLDVALESSVPIDVFSLIMNSAGQGEPGIVGQLLNVAKKSRPAVERQKWDELLAEALAEREQISNAATEVTGQRDQAFRAIDEEEAAVKARRDEAEQQAQELGLVTTSLASNNLANAYASDAKRTENQAARFTWASLAVGAVSVIVSAIGLIAVKEGSSFDTVIAHAAFGLPIALLAAYVNSLASTHRKEAWRLRHIELQIRTANPFLGLLDSDRRKETLAALALRFFPGQDGLDNAMDGRSDVPLDVIEALTKLVHEQRNLGQPNQTPPPDVRTG